MMMIILLVDMKEPYLQKTDILLNSKGCVTGVESMVTKIDSIQIIQRDNTQKETAVGSVPIKDISCLTARSS